MSGLILGHYHRIKQSSIEFATGDRTRNMKKNKEALFGVTAAVRLE